MKQRCKYHPRQVAHFSCAQCGSCFCPSCVVKREKGGPEPGQFLHFCPKCNLEVVWVGAANIIDPVWVRMPKIFLYPLRLNPMLLAGVFAAAVLFFSGPGWINSLLRGVVWLTILKYSFESLKSTARGNLQPPGISVETVFGDIWPVFKQGILYFLIALSFGYVTYKFGFIIGLGFILTALFFTPAMIILLVTTESLLFAINPLAFVRLVFRIGWAYLLMYLFLLLLAGAPAFLSQFFVPLLPERVLLVLQGFAKGFYTIISYHLMGYVILQYHDRIGYQVDYEDFQDPEYKPAAVAAADPDQAVLDEIEPLIQEGKLDRAIETVKRRAAAEGIRGLNLSERYYNLLRMRKRYKEMAGHGVKHLDLLAEEKQQTKTIQVYAECSRVDPDFLPSAPVLFKIGSWLNETGKTRQSVAVLNRMINAYPTHPLTPKAYFRAAQIFNDRLMSAQKAKRILSVLKRKYPQAEILPQVDNYLANL